MRGNLSDFWGKLKNSDGMREWHPLIDHCTDVAATCESLLRSSLLRSRLATLGGRKDLDETDIQRLAALAAFHDTGKFNIGFQNKASPDGRLPLGGHIQPLIALLNEDPRNALLQKLIANMPLAEIEGWAVESTGCELLVAAIAHHGRPPESGTYDVRGWKPDSLGRDPFEGIARLAAKVREWFPLAFEATTTLPLPASPEFQHAFSGLVTLADWLGSDRSVFRYSEVGDPERIDLARRWANQLLTRIGLNITGSRQFIAVDPRYFSSIFGFEPSPIQLRTAELQEASKGGLVILESETGSGKTEAALARFFALFAKGAVDGLYFALPTRTAAVQMYQRIERNIAHAFPERTTRPPIILAVPGYLPFDGRPNSNLLAPFDTLYPDRDAERYRRWAGEHPKRYLAGAISVGTVDQALLSALMVSHSHLRATSLLRQFLVVDEVHASDAYMATILREVLRFHLSAGGHAMLLSATLGSRAATPLCNPQATFAQPPSLKEAESRDYPSLTVFDVGTRTLARETMTSVTRTKSVAVELCATADDPSAVAGYALDAAAIGARVLVVRNTVRDCVATQLALERLAAKRGIMGTLFAVNGVPAPHHARFALPDRRLLDKRLERSFGHASTEACIVVATQTVQQSLDIDADLMLTDLCPVDVLLQRIGRLHRHARARPGSMKSARAIILTPARRDLTPLIGSDDSARGEHGFGTVYEDLRILEATWRLLETTPIFEIPKMNRHLVEGATHPEALRALVAQLGAPWVSHGIAIDGRTFAATQLATLNCIDRKQPLYEIRFPNSLDIRIRTRLGEDDRIVEFSTPIDGPFGAPLDRLSIPGWLVRDAAPDSRAGELVSSSGVFSFNYAQQAFTYDRLGLRLVVDHDAEEDFADA